MWSSLFATHDVTSRVCDTNASSAYLFQGRMQISVNSNNHEIILSVQLFLKTMLFCHLEHSDSLELGHAKRLTNSNVGETRWCYYKNISRCTVHRMSHFNYNSICILGMCVCFPPRKYFKC
jgi:hypothetical protein